MVLRAPLQTLRQLASYVQLYPTRLVEERIPREVMLPSTSMK